MTRISIVITLLVLCLHLSTKAQSDTSGVWVSYYLSNGDTLLYSTTRDVNIIAYRDDAYRSSRKYKKTVKRVKKMYPYSLLAARMYDDYQSKIDDFDSKKERRIYLKEEEKALKKEFE